MDAWTAQIAEDDVNAGHLSSTMRRTIGREVAGLLGLRYVLAMSLLVLVATGWGQTAFAATTLPQLPANVRDQLLIDALKREIEITQLQQELAEMQGLQDSELERKIKHLEDMRTLLHVNSEVRGLVQEAPELTGQYWRILEIDTPPPACRCLRYASVRWLGRGEQAGQAVIRLDGELHEVGVGDDVGDAGCRLQEADGSQAVLACGGSSRPLRLFNPLNAPPAGPAAQ